MSKTQQIKPGAGRRNKIGFPKGRQLDSAAFEDIKRIIGSAPRRDLLIEYLHQIQDTYGQLHTKHLRALAEWMKLSMAEVYEVATFYAHFIINDEETLSAPAPTIRVCESLTCCMMGADELYAQVKTLEPDARVLKAPCMGRCAQAPIVEVGHRHIGTANFDKVADALHNDDTHPRQPDYMDLRAYRAKQGYRLLENLREGKLTFTDIHRAVEKSGLRGLGGAGFPAAKKWEFVRAAEGPRYMCINGDEGEPGTFKDKHYLDSDPHRMLEGALICAELIEAERLFVYMRDEYPAIVDLLRAEVKKLESDGIVAAGFIEIRRGAGAYICGEESALIESVEGKRGLPRHRPPYVAQNGVFGRPTLVHNVETVYWIRDILEKGPEIFTDHGENGRVGMRSFSVSGDVMEPGVKFAPAGITLNDLIAQYCGGMKDGALKAYLPGGASGGILPATLADVPLDFDTLQAHDCFIGSAAVMVLSDKRDMKEVALNLMRFFEDESCGQCTPCRNGTSKAVQLMSEDSWDKSRLMDLADVMRDASICGLGQAAPNPLLSVMKHFPDEVGL